MFVLIAASAALQIAYAFPTARPAVFDVVASFDGFIPILGGQQGKAEVDLAISVQGLTPDPSGSPRVRSELTGFKLSFNGDAIPLELREATKLFPMTTLTTTKFGRTTKTDAPNKVLPIRLPGLDPMRLPDTTFLPIEFPEDGIELGKPWTFKKSFGDSDATITVTPTSITDDAVQMDLALSQKTSNFEDESLQVVTVAAEAATQVDTQIEGKGTATFARRSGLFLKYRIDTVATGVITDLKTHAMSKRKLVERIAVTIRS